MVDLERTPAEGAYFESDGLPGAEISRGIMGEVNAWRSPDWICVTWENLDHANQTIASAAAQDCFSSSMRWAEATPL